VPPAGFTSSSLGSDLCPVTCQSNGVVNSCLSGRRLQSSSCASFGSTLLLSCCLAPPSPPTAASAVASAASGTGSTSSATSSSLGAAGMPVPTSTGSLASVTGPNHPLTVGGDTAAPMNATGTSAQRASAFSAGSFATSFAVGIAAFALCICSLGACFFLRRAGAATVGGSIALRRASSPELAKAGRVTWRRTFRAPVSPGPRATERAAPRPL